MKKFLAGSLITMALVSTLNAEVYTGTSATFGASTGSGLHTRLDQYIGSSEYSWVYGKVGISQEMIPNYEIMPDWTLSSYPDFMGPSKGNQKNITSAIVGVGFNVLDHKNFFIDASLDYYYVVNSTSLVGVSGKDSTGKVHTIVAEPDISSPAVELGFGYSFGHWSLRLDSIILLSERTNVTVEVDDGTVYSTVPNNHLYFGAGVTYWY